MVKGVFVEMDYKKLLDRLKKLMNRQMYAKLPILLMVGILVGISFRVSSDEIGLRKQKEIETRAFNVFFGDKQIGTVRDKQTAENMLGELKVFLSDYEEKEKLLTKSDLTFEKTHVGENELVQVQSMKDSILQEISFNVLAYSILVDGKKIGTVKTKEEAQQVINGVKQPFIDDVKARNGELESIQMLESIEIKGDDAPLTAIKNVDDIVDYLRCGTTQKKIHKVVKGESLWSIAKNNKITVSELEQANPQFVNRYLQIGDELSLIVPKPFVTVVTKEKIQDKTKIGFDVKYINDSRFYEDETQVKRKGVYGEKQVLALVEKQNGIEKSRDIISETVLSSPKDQIELKGTKKIPPLKGTGIFKRPTSGKITSRYGPRWGSFHYGVDLASRTGTPIKAADSGTVSFAGYKGTYGYMVEINHGGGYTTRYAHCSKIYVKVGQKVYKDKTIAAVGSTGRSTGPHVHFEVRKYGKTMDPLTMINKKYR